jgi:hypothetical protein
VGLLDGLLDGLGWVWDNTVGAATDAVWDSIVGGLVGWVVDAIAWFVAAVLRFFEKSSTPDLTSNWFSGGGRIGPNAHSPYGVVAWLALSVLCVCILLGVIQGLLTGEGPAMAPRIARDVALAILGIVATIGVTQVLLGATDELAHLVLDQTEAGANAKDLLRRLAEPAAFTSQGTFVVFLLGLVAVVGGFVLWVELLIRASLLYLLLALSPLAYAAFAWPAARRIVKRIAELVIAIVVSKLVIAIALAVSASALSRGPRASGGVPTGEAKIGTLLVGVIMFCLAAFAPFLILKLLPVVEAAVVAQGISRSPVRTAQSATATSFYVARLAGGAATGGAAAGAASAGTKPTGNGAGTSAGGARGSPATRPSEPPSAPRSNQPGATAPRASAPRLDLGGANTPEPKDQP